jgi:hypothetical protein
VERLSTISKVVSVELKVSNHHDVPRASGISTTTMVNLGSSYTIKLKEKAGIASAIPMDTADVMRPTTMTSTNSNVNASTSQAMLDE